jgi:GNAT superfamily N-acetyltransferase
LPVVCRPARPSDTGDVLELTRTIWDGHDYVPEVWDAWLSDPQGLLAVAEYQGRVLGLGKLTRLSGEDWWLEGLRVHPEYQGRGIASQINDYLLAHWLHTGSGALRLATNSERVQVHHMCQRNRFTKVAEFTWYVAPSLTEWGQTTAYGSPIKVPSNNQVAVPGEVISNADLAPHALPGGQIPEDVFQPLRPEEIPQAVAFARQSPTLALSDGLMNLRWRWASPVETFFVLEVERQRIWWWRQGRALLITGDDEDDEGNPTAIIKLLACSLEDAPACLKDFRRLSAALGFSTAGWLAPVNPQLFLLLNAAGFQRDWDNSLHLFEKWLE